MKSYFNIIKLVQKLDPWALIIAIIYNVSKALMPMMFLWVSGTVINGVASNMPLATLQNTMINLLIIMGVIYTINAVFKKLFNDHNELLYYRLQASLINKSLVMDYAALEDPSNRLKFTKAEEASNYSGGIFAIMTYSISAIVDIVLALIITSASIIYLATAQATTSGSLAQLTNSYFFPILIVFLLVTPLYLSYKAHMYGNDLQIKSFEDISYVNREMGYFYTTILTNVEQGKTVRMYNASHMILDVIQTGTNYFIDKLTKNNLKIANIQALGTLATVLSMGALYILLAIKAITGAISIGDIVIIGGALQTITNSLFKSVTEVSQINNILNFFKYYLDYLDLPESDLLTNKAPFEEMNIEFENVSFKYPGSETEVLSNVSFKIKDGERISLVGRNGAGKTTLVKLLTRLYQPTEGRILINGIDIQELEMAELLNNLSIVFQDFSLYPFSVKENIILNSKEKEDRVHQALESTEMLEKVTNLPQGLETLLKAEYNDGVGFSGGEAQKLAISRAWYKDSPMIILDEPTAALDPMSEFEIYNHFNQLIDNRSALYISHRMSSSQFSDRIIVFEHGTIKEMGTHKELLKVNNGIYKELFETQAQYYQ